MMMMRRTTNRPTAGGTPERPLRTITDLALISALLTAFLCFTSSCRRADDQPSVVLYVSADDHFARLVADAFEQETGIDIKLVGDMEAKKTTGLVQRLRAEQDNPQADVFWSSEIFMTIQLADEGVFAPITSTELADWPESHRHAEHLYYAFAARARVIAYHGERVAEQDIPKTWTDLTRDSIASRTVMADPRFGTTGGHLGAMMLFYDRAAMPGYYAAYMSALHDNGVRMLPSGNAGVVRAIIEGQADFGMTDTDDVWAAQAAGHDIKLVYPDHTHEDMPGNGTLLIPNTVAIVKGGPNPDHALRLVEFLLSGKVERMLAESDSHNIPLRPDIAEQYPQYAVSDPLMIDFKRAAAMRTDAVNIAMTIFGDPTQTKPIEAPDAPDEQEDDAR
jgi:iron(III) transport system substrate-binding protein